MLLHPDEAFEEQKKTPSRWWDWGTRGLPFLSAAVKLSFPSKTRLHKNGVCSLLSAVLWEEVSVLARFVKEHGCSWHQVGSFASLILLLSPKNP